MTSMEQEIFGVRTQEFPYSLAHNIPVIRARLAGNREACHRYDDYFRIFTG
jgi:hypothetical protein